MEPLLLQEGSHYLHSQVFLHCIEICSSFKLECSAKSSLIYINILFVSIKEIYYISMLYVHTFCISTETIYQ